MALAAVIVLFQLPPGTGIRGCAAAAALGCMQVPAASLVQSLCNQHSDYTPAHRSVGVDPASSWSMVPGVFLIASGLLCMGLISHQYGIRAVAQWEGLVLGTCVGLAWTMVALRALASWAYADVAMGNLSGAALVVVALPWMAVMGTFHYLPPSTAPWFPIFAGIGVLAGWTITVVTVAVLSHGQGSRLAAVASAGVMAVALGASSLSAQAIVKDNVQPAIAAGFLAALFLMVVSSSTQRLLEAHQAPEDAPSDHVDTVASVAAVLILASVAWVGFKLLLGYGVLMAALGMLAAFPAAVALGVSSPSAQGVRVPERVASLGGAFLVLLGGMKVLQQEGGMMLSGIDIAEGNVAIALVFGILLPVILEGVSGRRPAFEKPTSPMESILGAGARWLALMGVMTTAVIGGGLYFGLDGVTAMALGVAVWAVLAAGSTAASAAEEGLLTFRALGLAPAFVALAVLLLPYKSVVLDVTRLQKQNVAQAMALFLALALVVAGLLRKRWMAPPPAEEAPSETSPAPPESDSSAQSG